jgi:hypothetical protein
MPILCRHSSAVCIFERTLLRHVEHAQLRLFSPFCRPIHQPNGEIWNQQILAGTLVLSESWSQPAKTGPITWCHCVTVRELQEQNQGHLPGDSVVRRWKSGQKRE